MKKKHLVLTFILLISATLLISGCGEKNKTAEQAAAANNPPAENAAEQATPPTEQEQGQQQTQEPETKNTMSWDNPPAMQIDTNKSYEAEITTTKGTIKLELFAKDAPITVNNFVFLAEQGFYNDVIFHRVLETFVIQTGDPEGTGQGGPGYRFEDESTDYEYEPGIVAMANAGPDTNGSQFFICTGEDSKSLNMQPYYTIFGKVIDGMDVVQEIAATPVQAGSDGAMSSPIETIQMKEIKITVK